MPSIDGWGFNLDTLSLAHFLSPSVANSVPISVSLLLNFEILTNIYNPILLGPLIRIALFPAPPPPISVPVYLLISFLFYLCAYPIKVDSIYFYFAVIIKPFLFCLWKTQGPVFTLCSRCNLYPVSLQCILWLIIASPCLHYGYPWVSPRKMLPTSALNEFSFLTLYQFF